MFLCCLGISVFLWSAATKSTPIPLYCWRVRRCLLVFAVGRAYLLAEDTVKNFPVLRCVCTVVDTKMELQLSKSIWWKKINMVMFYVTSLLNHCNSNMHQGWRDMFRGRQTFCTCWGANCSLVLDVKSVNATSSITWSWFSDTLTAACGVVLMQ